MHSLKTSEMSKGLLFLMTSAVSATAANLYFNQPVLPQIGMELNLSGDALGTIPAASQLGYAIALLFISPLGDNMSRKALISMLSLLLVASATFAFYANGLLMLIASCFFIGLSANITQQLIPFAASLSTQDNKGKIIATLMTGLTVGIVLSRTLSGFVGEQFGWRAVFMMSALFALVFGVLLHLYLPNNKPNNKMPYIKLVLSMFSLLKQHAILRKSTLTGALWFAAFSALLTTLALHVNEAPFGYNAQQAGMFGMIAITGVLGAKVSGALVNKLGPRKMTSLGLICIAAGFAIAGVYGSSLIGLILGIAFIDMGVFSAQVSNQVRVFSIEPTAQSRINGIYMLGYYIGGAFGSFVGVSIFEIYGWQAVSLFSAVLVIMSLLVNNAKDN
ncbi:MFS transporter [Psychromonas algicola]|uniref:MFS transporter n=1 Tax=Psychromonas algicola TaxID=2555642 RepID=UPI001FBB08B6|nr:MFS transporter [Psychromonas sp. RZ5]